MLKRLTIDEARNISPMVLYEELRPLFKGRETVSALDVLRCESLSRRTKLHLAFDEAFIGKPLMEEFVAVCCEEVFKMLKIPDPSLIESAQAFAAFARGEIQKSELTDLPAYMHPFVDLATGIAGKQHLNDLPDWYPDHVQMLIEFLGEKCA